MTDEERQCFGELRAFLETLSHSLSIDRDKATIEVSHTDDAGKVHFDRTVTLRDTLRAAARLLEQPVLDIGTRPTARQ
jgi:hypothetical protein